MGKVAEKIVIKTTVIERSKSGIEIRAVTISPLTIKKLFVGDVDIKLPDKPFRFRWRFL